jgi:hypothetical protein
MVLTSRMAAAPDEAKGDDLLRRVPYMSSRFRRWMITAGVGNEVGATSGGPWLPVGRAPETRCGILGGLRCVIQRSPCGWEGESNLTARALGGPQLERGEW